MPITREMVAGKLAAYLHHEISVHALVDWAERAMMGEELERVNHDAIRDVVARLGLPNVQTFELTWEDCETILKRLGYIIRIEIRLLATFGDDGCAASLVIARGYP